MWLLIEETFILYSFYQIIFSAFKSRMRQTVHEARIEELRILFGKPEGKRDHTRDTTPIAGYY